MLDFISTIFSDATRVYREFRPSQSIEHTFVVDKIDLDKVSQRMGLLPQGVICHVLRFKYFNGVYLQENTTHFLIITMDKVSDDFLQNGFDQSIDSEITNEMSAYGKKHRLQKLETINVPCFVSLIVCVAKAFAFRFEISNFEDVFALKTYHTYLKFVKNMEDLRNGIQIGDLSHIDRFSIIYFHELQAIQRSATHSEKGIVIHDVGTNMGFLPILSAGLKEAGELGFRLNDIIGSDLDLNPIVSNLDRIRIISQKSGKALPSLNLIRTMEIDILNPIPVDCVADVVVANDLIEHFDEGDSERILLNLWKSTHDLLLIHVPFEEEANSAYGHFRTFNEEALVRMSKLLDGAKDVTPSELRRIGHLYLKKIARETT